jgi:hypothetical protein
MSLTRPALLAGLTLTLTFVILAPDAQADNKGRSVGNSAAKASTSSRSVSNLSKSAATKTSVAKTSSSFSNRATTGKVASSIGNQVAKPQVAIRTGQLNPAIKNPVIKNPIVHNPVVTNPIGRHPIGANPVIKNPIVTNPIGQPPVIKHPIVTNPIIGLPGIKNPIVTKPIINTPICPPGGHPHHKPICPPVCRPWINVHITAPVRPCVIRSCHTVCVANVSTVEVLVEDRLTLISGQAYQLAAEHLGEEPGVVVLEVNGVGLPVSLVEWRPDGFEFVVPTVALQQPTPGQLHVINSLGQLLGSMPVDLLPAPQPVAAQ